MGASPVFDEEEPVSLQARLEQVGSREGQAPHEQEAPTIADPVGLLRYLESTGRFHRDSVFGRIFHPGRVSFRENQPTDSLHIVVRENHVSAHVDRVSPLGIRPERPSRYSVRRAAVHNVAGMYQDLISLLRGRQGDHRSELSCEWIVNPSEDDAGDDDSDHPTAAGSVQLEVRVAGCLDETRLREALAATLSRHPVDHDPLEVVSCGDDAALDQARERFHNRPVPPDASPPLRVQVARHPEGDVLMVNVNHAASDGFGALQVLHSLADSYAGTPANPPPDFLAVQDLPVRPAPATLPVWLRGWRGVVEHLRDALARPARLAPDQAVDEDGYGFHIVRLTAEETSRIGNRDRPGTSRNVLMAGLHLAIGEWNLEHGGPGRRTGVLVPVNLRPPDWRDETVGNFSVTSRVSTSRRHRADGRSALTAITSQTTRNKHTRTGIALVAALDRAGLLPLWAKQSRVVLQPLTGNRLVDTAMLANLGWLDDPPSFGPEAGDTVEMWFSVPARAPQALCLGAVTVSGRLHLVFRYPRRLFGADAARRFAECYLSQIRQVAEHRESS